MHSIVVPGVNQALEEGLWWLHVAGVQQVSRNGPVLVAPGPVCTTYTNPQQRVLLYQERDANPFFHIFESLWMLAGRDDVAFVETYAKQMREFSDNGTTLQGAYGYRWRHWFNHDQLSWIIDELKWDVTSRRAVLGMWDAEEDPHAVAKGTKDAPCNTHAFFDTIDNRLNMTVCCRSNDIIWGAYGANAVHFSVLLEYMAACIGLPVGVYRQVSNNYHIYTARADVLRLYADRPIAFTHRPYPAPLVPLINTTRETWEHDLTMFFEAWEADALPTTNFIDPFFTGVVQPLALAHAAYKGGYPQVALECLTRCTAADWRLAAQEWIQRRIK